MLGAEEVTQLQALSVRHSGDQDERDLASALQEELESAVERETRAMVLPGMVRY